MQIFQLNAEHFQEMKHLGIPHLLLESQVYGNRDEFLYHVVTTIERESDFVTFELGRKVEDKGRTAGFWQNLGGSGIYSPKTVALQGFSANLATLLASQPEAKISFPAETWEEIVGSMPFNETQKKKILGESTVKTDKSSKRRKKRQTK